MGHIMTGTQTCSCCGAVIPTPNEFNFSPMELSVYNYIAKHPGCTKRTITNDIYALDPSGGPNYNIVAVYVCRINKKLDGSDQRIICGSAASYRLVKKEVPSHVPSPHDCRV